MRLVLAGVMLAVLTGCMPTMEEFLRTEREKLTRATRQACLSVLELRQLTPDELEYEREQCMKREAGVYPFPEPLPVIFVVPLTN